MCFTLSRLKMNSQPLRRREFIEPRTEPTLRTNSGHTMRDVVVSNVVSNCQDVEQEVFGSRSVSNGWK